MALGRKPIEIVNSGKHQLLVKAKHWSIIYLNEVADVQNGFAFSSAYFSKNDGIQLIRIRDIDNTSTFDKYIGNYNDSFIVRRGDILIGMDGDFKVAKWKGACALLNQRVCRIIPKAGKYNEKFLFFCLQPFLDAIHSETSSVTVKHISYKTIEEIPLPFPSLKEQSKIVSKIEELFNELEKGIESLFTAKQQLKTYRQSVLKWAFEGKLTNGLNCDSFDLHDEHDLSIAAEPEVEYKTVKNQSNQKNHSNQRSDKGELPEGWKWVKLGEVSQCILGKMLDKQKNVGTLKPYLRNINVRWNGFKLDDIFEMRFQENEDERFGIIKGDLIICEGGEPGRSAIWKGQMPNMKIQKALHRVRFDKSTKAEYFLYYLNLISSTKHIDSYFTGTTIKHLTGQSLKKILVPLPPIKEQHLIVQAIENRLSVAEKMEESITQSLQQAEALKQSILKKAFEGKLV